RSGAARIGGSFAALTCCTLTAFAFVRPSAFCTLAALALVGCGPLPLQQKRAERAYQSERSERAKANAVSVPQRAKRAYPISGHRRRLDATGASRRWKPYLRSTSLRVSWNWLASTRSR